MKRVEFFTKGLGPRIGDMGKPMRDGDGDGKCQERGGKWVPCPPNVGNGTFLWDEISDLIDFETLTKVDDPEEAELAFNEMFRDDWLRWKECRAIRQKAYDIAQAKDSLSDPHLRRTDPNLFGDPKIDVGEMSPDEYIEAQAKYVMGQLAIQARSDTGNYRPLYRAVKLEDDEKDSFFQSMQVGEEVAIPLMATSSQREVAGVDVIGQFGTDALIVVHSKSAKYGLHNIGVHAGQEFEIMMLDDLEAQVDDLQAQIEDAREAGDLELVDQLQYNADAIENAIRAYETARKSGTQREILDALSDIRDNHLPDTDYPLPGDPLEGDHPHPQAQQLWNDSWDFETETEQPAEYVTGGTFKVISVEDDPRSLYGRVIVLEQTGVYDPGNPGQVIPVGSRQ